MCFLSLLILALKVLPSFAVPTSCFLAYATSFSNASFGVSFFFAFALTVIVHLYFLLPYLAVIVALPFFFAVTTPLELTVAIFLFDELHFNL